MAAKFFRSLLYEHREELTAESVAAIKVALENLHNREDDCVIINTPEELQEPITKKPRTTNMLLSTTDPVDGAHIVSVKPVVSVPPPPVATSAPRQTTVPTCNQMPSTSHSKPKAEATVLSASYSTQMEQISDHMNDSPRDASPHNSSYSTNETPNSFACQERTIFSITSSGEPQLPIPSVYTVTPTSIKLHLPSVREHFTNFNFFAFFCHLCKFPFYNTSAFDGSSPTHLVLCTGNPDLLDYHLQHYFFTLSLHAQLH